MKLKIKKIVAIAAIILFIANNSTAVAIVDLPKNADPGSVDKTNLNGFVEGINKSKTDLPNEQNDLMTNGHKEYRQGDYVYNPKFKLQKIVFSGNSVYSEAKLQKIAQNIMDKEVFIDDVVDVAIKITKLYQNNGYILSKAYLPPQKVVNGVIEIRISENKVGNISINGNKWAKTNYLKKTIFESNKESEGKIFNVNRISGSLQDLNENDYIKGRIEVVDTEDPQYSDIVLNVKDRLPVSLSINWDNEGRELVGIQRALVMLSYNNLTGYGDSIYGGAVLADTTVGAVGGYKLPLNSKGTALNFNYSYSNIELGKQYTDNRIKGTSRDYNISLINPLCKTSDFKLISDVSFDMRSVITKQNDVGAILNRYATRVLRTGINATKYDSHGRWFSRVETSFGLPMMGATKDDILGNSGRDIASSKFFKFNTDLLRLQRLPLDSLGIFRLATQYSPDKLLASEQMQIGGVSTVRGFEPALVLGDKGLNGTLEVRTHVPFFARILPRKLRSVDDKVRLGYFYDWGVISIKNKQDYPDNGNFLQSIGVGVHMLLADYLATSFDIGVPLGRQKYDSQSVRLHFSVSSNVDRMFFRPSKEAL